MTITNNDWAQVTGKSKLTCMVDNCDFKAKTWITHKIIGYDLNGIELEEGTVRNKHVCYDCSDELQAVFGWNRLEW